MMNPTANIESATATNAGFKQTEVGRVPVDWIEETFDKLCWVNQGLQIPIANRLIRPEIGSKKYITIEYINKGKDAEFIKEYNTSVCCDYSDILMTRTGNTGIVVTNVKGVFHNNFFKINYDKKQVLKEYLVYYLNQPLMRKLILEKAGTSTIPDLNHKDFYSLPFVAPPTLAEQTAIATALSDMDALIQAQEELLAKKRALKQGAMQELLTGKRRLVEAASNTFKQTEVGRIPVDWSIEPIGKHFDFKNGLNKEKKYFGSGLPIVNYMDVFQNTIITNNVIHGKVNLTREEKNRYNVRIGDVFFTRTSETREEIGVSAVCIEELKETVFSGFILRARPKTSGFDIQFCRYCFSPQLVREQIERTASITTRALTNGRLLSEILIPLPPTLTEQNVIANTLSDMDTEIKQLEAQLAKYQKLKAGMMQELLTGKKRLV